MLNLKKTISIALGFCSAFIIGHCYAQNTNFTANITNLTNQTMNVQSSWVVSSDTSGCISSQVDSNPIGPGSTAQAVDIQSAVTYAPGCHVIARGSYQLLDQNNNKVSCFFTVSGLLMANAWNERKGHGYCGTKAFNVIETRSGNTISFKVTFLPK